MNRLQRLYRSAANWRVPRPWWFKGATFGALLIGLSLAIIDDYQHAEHMNAKSIIVWFFMLLFMWRAASAYRDLPRYWDCDEPTNWETMTPDPFKTLPARANRPRALSFLPIEMETVLNTSDTSILTVA
jgi:hypothetical protein